MIKVEHKKSLVKPLSLNFDKTLIIGKGAIEDLPTIFQKYPCKKREAINTLLLLQADFKSP